MVTLLFRLTDGCVASSLLTTGLFAISKLTWTWSVSAEVFGLNNLFVAVLMFLAVLFESTIHDTNNMTKVCTFPLVFNRLVALGNFDVFSIFWHLPGMYILILFILVWPTSWTTAVCGLIVCE